MTQERAEQLKTAAPIDSSKCPRSPEYETVIEVFARNLYDPTKLGDLQALKSKHNCEIKKPADAIEFANQEISAIDGFSRLHLKGEIEAQQIARRGDLVGVGAVFSRPNSKDLNSDRGPIEVVELVDGAPAAKAGLKVGDQIVAVDKKSVESEHLLNAIDRVKGRADSHVELTIKRDGKVFDLEVVRAQVHFPAVEEKSLGQGIAYVQLDSFVSDSGPLELARAILKHKDAEAVVLDLRDNPGGAQNNTMLIASLFIDQGLVSNQQARVDSPAAAPAFSNNSLVLTNDFWLFKEGGESSKFPRLPDLVDVPIAVLVNERSASAAEMVAAALRDNVDAKLVGSQTFGKGVGQRFIPIPSLGGMLRVTDHKSMTPDGDWVGDADKNRIGLKPDIEVKLPKGVRFGSPEDTQLNAAVLYLTTQIAATRKAH